MGGMRELERRQKLRKRLYSLPSLAGLAVLTFFLGKAAYSGFLKFEESSHYRANLEAQVVKLTEREASLSRNIEKLQTEEGLKHEIKEKFSVSEEGEYMAVIVDARNIPTTTEEESKSWFARWWDAIIGR